MGSSTRESQWRIGRGFFGSVLGLRGGESGWWELWAGIAIICESTKVSYRDYIVDYQMHWTGILCMFSPLQRSVKRTNSQLELWSL